MVAGMSKARTTIFEFDKSENVSRVDQLENGTPTADGSRSEYLAKVVFLGGVTTLGVLAGFGSAIAMAKKRDPTSFDKGFLMLGAERLESGGSLAMRALGWGTVFAVGGVGLLCFSVYRILDVHSAEDLRRKMSSIMPPVPKRPANPNERTEFASIREFFEYIGNEKKK